MAFDLCVIPVATVPYLSALQTRQFSTTEITAHLVSVKLTREQCRSMTHETFSSSYGSSAYALHVRSSVSSEINLALTSYADGNSTTGYSVVIQGYLVSQGQWVILGVCVSDEPIVADTSLHLFVNIEETNNVFRLRADFDGMVTQGLLDDILARYVTTDTKQTITSTKTLRSGEFRTNLNISDIAVEYVPSFTSGYISTATLASDGIHADGVSFKNAYGRAADNYLVASVSGNGGYSELSSLGGHGFTFCYKGADETDNHYPLRIEAGITTFDENQTLYLAKDTNTYLRVNDAYWSVKDYVERIVGSGSSKFVVADVDTLDPTQLSNPTDYRPSNTSSDNPHYDSKEASFKFDVSELPSNGTTFEVFMPSTSFVGSVQLVCESSNYIYPIYFRGNNNVHCPTIPQGSVLRITFYNDAFYGDFYDLADFGDEHEAYVYVGKVPLDKSSSELSEFLGLVGIDRDTGKFSQMFTVEVTSNGAFFANSPRLRENSPIYACFQGDCFAAHPKVPFGNILRIYDEFYVQETLQIHMLPFTYYPFDDGDTVEAHIVVNTSSKSAHKYFQVDDCPVYIQSDSNSVLIGNPPDDVHARLIGFMCSGAENAGMIRLVENDAVSYISDDDYSKIFAGVWDYNTVDLNTQTLSGSPLSSDSDNVLVVLSKSSSKLVPLLVPGPCTGDVMVNTQFDWESPIYALFEGFRCFSAHPMVDFRQIIGSNSVANSPVFISDYDETFHETDKRFCVGIPYDVNIPSSCIHWRLLGYTTSTPGYIRLTESHPFLKDFIYKTGGYVKLSDFTDIFYDASYGSVNPSQYVDYLRTKGFSLDGAVNELIHNYGNTVFNIKDLDAQSVYATEMDGEVYVSLPSMTTVEFEDRMSFRTSAGEAAYIDSDGVYHGKSTSADSATSSTYARYLRYSSTNVLSAANASVVTSNATIRPASSTSSLDLGASSYKWGSVYATYLGNMSYPLTSSYSTSLYCTNVYSSGSSAVQCFTLGTNSSYANDISIPGTNLDGSRGYLHPYEDYGADLGSYNNCFNKVWTNDIQAFGTISGNLEGNATSATTATTATRATQDGSGNTITSSYASDISVTKVSWRYRTWSSSGIGSLPSTTSSQSMATNLSLISRDTSLLKSLGSDLKDFIANTLTQFTSTSFSSPNYAGGVGCLRIGLLWRASASASGSVSSYSYYGFLASGSDISQVSFYTDGQEIKCELRTGYTFSSGTWMCLSLLPTTTFASGTVRYPLGLFVRIA